MLIGVHAFGAVCAALDCHRGRRLLGRINENGRCFSGRKTRSKRWRGLGRSINLVMVRRGENRVGIVQQHRLHGGIEQIEIGVQIAGVQRSHAAAVGKVGNLDQLTVVQLADRVVNGCQLKAFVELQSVLFECAVHLVVHSDVYLFVQIHRYIAYKRLVCVKHLLQSIQAVTLAIGRRKAVRCYANIFHHFRQCKAKRPDAC